MILVVGGLGSGKTEYVRSLGYRDEDIAHGILDDSPVLDALHELVRRQEGGNEDFLRVLLEKEVVICREVGCGVVPVDKGDRDWRDEVGRLCVQLAAHSTRVVRLCCGIPTVIKDVGL